VESRPALTIAFASLLAIGLLLLGLGSIWTMISDGSSSWTQEKADQWSKTSNRLEVLSFAVHAPPGSEVSGRLGKPEDIKAEYDRVKLANEEFAAAFDEASNGPKRMAATLKWSGVAIAAVGAVGAFSTRPK
jgi:hypothetical protein